MACFGVYSVCSSPFNSTSCSPRGLSSECCIGGYTLGPHGLDAIIVGFLRSDNLVYVARTRNGFVPASRRRLFEKLRQLRTSECPSVSRFL
jgi:ATP-dependent DNA ligase